jgi:hypothetical protein
LVYKICYKSTRFPTIFGLSFSIVLDGEDLDATFRVAMKGHHTGYASYDSTPWCVASGTYFFLGAYDMTRSYPRPISQPPQTKLVNRISVVLASFRCSIT